MRMPLVCVATVLGLAGDAASKAIDAAESTDQVVIDNPYGEAARGVFYESRATLTQRVKVKNANSLRIECYCPVRDVRKAKAQGKVTLIVDGLYKISGYHGSGKEAGAEALSSGALKFNSSVSGSELKLTGPEWRYIHHSLTVTKLIVHAPEGVTVTFDELTREALEGRKVAQ